MPRTEKKFGTANQVSSTTVTQLVTPSANRKNVIINAAGRGTGTLDIAVTSGNGVMSLGSPLSTTSAVTTTARTAFITSLSSTTANPDGNNGHVNGMAFNKELTKVAYVGPGNDTQIARASINSSTGAVTDVSSQTYLGTGNSSLFYYHQLFNTDPMPGSNNFKIFGNDGVDQNSASAGNPGQTIMSSFGRARYNAISSSTNYMQYSISYWNSSAGWQAYSYGSTVPVTGDTYGRGVAFVTIPNHPNGTIARGCYFITEAESSSYSANTNIGFNKGYADSSVTGSQYAYYGSVSGPSSSSDIGGNASNVFPFTYNSQRNHWAISLNTSGTGHGAYWNTSNAGPQMVSKSSAINPGFRITVDDSGDPNPVVRAFFYGTDKTPAMPTGVTVPSLARPLRSLKFSPDGTKLAVAYNRDYSGTGNTNSVIVIYTWDSATSTWIHTHSSGSDIPFRPYNNDCMVWAGDSSLLAIAGTDGIVRMWGPGLTASSSKVSVSIGNGPDMSSLTSGGVGSPVSHAATFTGSLNAGTGLTVNGNHPGSFVRELVYVPTATSPYRFVAILGHTTLAVPTSANSNTVIDGVTTVSMSVNNYVSSVASNLPIVNGNVTQITGIVLEANEGLAVEASVSGIVDVNAYGVEIS